MTGGITIRVRESPSSSDTSTATICDLNFFLQPTFYRLYGFALNFYTATSDNEFLRSELLYSNFRRRLATSNNEFLRSELLYSNFRRRVSSLPSSRLRSELCSKNPLSTVLLPPKFQFFVTYFRCKLLLRSQLLGRYQQTTGLVLR
jgi:hypothetical protein